MLLLASTSDLIRVVTSSTSAVDVHASWVDLNGSTVTPGRTNTLISSATTTTVVGSPGSSTYRTVKALTIRNRGGANNTVTVLHSDGTLIPEVAECVLEPDESLHYHEAAGWWVTTNNFLQKTAQYASGTVPSSSGILTTVLGSDVTNNNATANTIADVTGLDFAVLANKLYWFEFNVVYTAAATATGSRWSVSGPATTYLLYRSEYSLTATTTTRNAMLTAYNLPAASNATSAATTQNWAQVEGLIQPSADGTVIARFASEVSSSAIVAKAGSFVRYQQITA